MNPEIVTNVQRPVGAEPEPSLTISQLRSLLHAAAELERAQRPIIMHPAAPSAAVAHPGPDVRTAAPAPAPALRLAEAGRRNPWPLVFMVSGCAGLGSSVLAAATGSQFAILAVFASLAAWGAATYQLVFVREP